MKTLLLGIIITVSVAALVAITCFVFAKIAIEEIHKDYRKLLIKRDDELLDLKRDNERLSKRNAELEAATTLERVNAPQEEFFTVPKRVTR